MGQESNASIKRRSVFTLIAEPSRLVRSNLAAHRTISTLFPIRLVPVVLSVRSSSRKRHLKSPGVKPSVGQCLVCQSVSVQFPWFTPSTIQVQYIGILVFKIPIANIIFRFNWSVRQFTTGCMSSKTAADPAEKDAQQRNVKIEKILKSDRKTMDRTIRILLLGTCSPAGNEWYFRTDYHD